MSSKFDNFIRVKEKFPYHGKGIDELLSALKRVLEIPDNKYTQKIVLEVGVPHIYVEKLVTSDEAGKLPKQSVGDMIRTQQMEEFESEKNIPAWQQLWEMFSILSKEGLEVGFIAIGNKIIFQNWLGVRIPMTDMRLLGIPVVIVDDLPDYALVICGTPERVADPEDIQFCLKGNINEANNKEISRGGPNK